MSREDAVLVRTDQYDNSKAFSRLVFLDQDREEIPVVWAWPIRREDLPAFFSVYDDVEWREVDSSPYVYSFPWKRVDHLVASVDWASWRVRPIKALKGSHFDSHRHTAVREDREVFCWCGCGRPEGFSEPYFETPWVVVLAAKEIAFWRLEERKPWLC